MYSVRKQLSKLMCFESSLHLSKSKNVKHLFLHHAVPPNNIHIRWNVKQRSCKYQLLKSIGNELTNECRNLDNQTFGSFLYYDANNLTDTVLLVALSCYESKALLVIAYFL